MKIYVPILTASLIAAAVPLQAQAGRPTDKQVKSTLEKSARTVESFRQAVDSKVKGMTIRTASSEVDVFSYVKDLEEACETARNRFSGSYAASSEVTRCLKAAKAVDQRAERGGQLAGGADEWAKARPELRTLAASYNVDWSTDPTGWSARRMNDKEVDSMLGKLASDAKRFSKSYGKDLKKDKTLSDEARQELSRRAETLATATQDLDRRFAKGEDVSAALANVGSASDAVAQGAEGKSLSSTASSAWNSVQNAVEQLPAAFGKG